MTPTVLPARLAGAVALGLALLATSPVEAQTLQAVRTTDFALSAGVSFPQGDAGDVFDTGFIVSGAVNYRPVNSLLGYRVEGLYTRLGAEMGNTLDTPGESYSLSGRFGVLGLTGNVVLNIPTASAIRPYLIGGAGAYRTTTKWSMECSLCSQATPSVSKTDTDFGLNGGAGVEFRLGTLRPYVEGRFHSIFTSGDNVNFIPVQIGLRF